MTYFIIFLVAYSLVSIALGLFDITRISSKGKRLNDRKKMLESLAAVHGYSPSGWNRYREYQEFMSEYGDIVTMYRKYKKSPVSSGLKMILSSFIILPILAGASIKGLWNVYKTEQKENRENKKKDA